MKDKKTDFKSQTTVELCDELAKISKALIVSDDHRLIMREEVILKEIRKRLDSR